jgi:hypothetical protein
MNTEITKEDGTPMGCHDSKLSDAYAQISDRDNAIASLKRRITNFIFATDKCFDDIAAGGGISKATAQEYRRLRKSLEDFTHRIP